ncbi:MAG: nuclear transport factor 2 family protein [Acidobacteria bacterium]|nr:nuclear transport factor 2 family protein [Acidobacteriota bacterium]
MFKRPQFRRAITLIALVSAIAPSTFAQKNPHHERKHLEREQIVALEAAWQQAALADDVATMDKLLSDDYLGITATGEVLTKAQQLDHMRDKKLVLTQLKTSQLKIKLIGHIAIVTSLAEVEGTSDGDTLQGAYRYTRVYQRMPNGSWKITSFEVTPTTKLHASAADPD